MEFDVAIVGGGPAGSSTALHLARACSISPSRVVLFDRAIHPREKPCGGAVSAWGLHALDRIGVPLSVPHVVMRGVRVLEGNSVGETTIMQKGGMGVIIRRTEFDADLLNRARQDGVVVREGEGVMGVTQVPGGWSIRTSGAVVTAKILVACDGAGSTVRKLLGLGEAARKGHLYVTDTEATDADEAVTRDFCDFDFSPSTGLGRTDAVHGYYWDFPTIVAGKRLVNRGIYHANLSGPANGQSPHKVLLEKSLARRKIKMSDVVLRPFSTRPLVRGARIESDGVLFVGEAAGIDRGTGEGIAQSIHYGEIAARHVAGALRKNQLHDFSAYAREVRRSTMGKHLLQSAWFADRVFSKHGGWMRAVLIHSAVARELGIRWYLGESIGVRSSVQFGADLLRGKIGE